MKVIGFQGDLRVSPTVALQINQAIVSSAQYPYDIAWTGSAEPALDRPKRRVTIFSPVGRPVVIAVGANVNHVGTGCRNPRKRHQANQTPNC